MLKNRSCNNDSVLPCHFKTNRFTFAAVKKVLGFIMAFMVLAFSMVPCADDASFATKVAKYEVAQKLPQNSDQNHEDACSPFCICSCCAGFSVATQLSGATDIFIPYQSSYSSFFSERPNSRALPIWQPPQLA